MSGQVDPSESLTLDPAARERATRALSTELRAHTHHCDKYEEDGVCTVCWALAADVVRAAEGLQLCGRCNGGGMVAPGACCPICGGDGLEPTDADNNSGGAPDDAGRRQDPRTEVRQP